MSPRARRLLISAAFAVALASGLMHCQALLDTTPRSDAATPPADAGAPQLDAGGAVAVDANDAAEAAVPYCAAAFDGSFFCNDFDHKFDWLVENGAGVDSLMSSSPPNSLLSKVAPNTQGCEYARAAADAPGQPDVSHVRLSALVFLDPDHFEHDIFYDMRLISTADGTECQVLIVADWNGTVFTLGVDQQINGALDKLSGNAGAVSPRRWTRIELDADFANGPITLRVDGSQVLAPPLQVTCGHGTVRAFLGFHYACESTLSRSVWFDDVVIETK